MSGIKKFFKFPVRIYDDFSLAKAFFAESKKLEQAENVEEVEEPERGQWVQGWARVQVDDILGWMDHFEEGTPVKDVAEEGFDMTMVYVKNIGKFECTWKREKFESAMEAHINNLP